MTFYLFTFYYPLCFLLFSERNNKGKLQCILIMKTHFDSETLCFPPIYIPAKFFFSWGNCLLLMGLDLLIKDQFIC